MLKFTFVSVKTGKEIEAKLENMIVAIGDGSYQGYKTYRYYEYGFDELTNRPVVYHYDIEKMIGNPHLFTLKSIEF